MRSALAPLALAACALLGGCSAGEDCSMEVDDLVERGWVRYREDSIQEAGGLFREARKRCREHVGARIGLGYVALRSQDTAAARRWFEAVLAEDSTVTDALVGLGLVEWRVGNNAAARSLLFSAVAADPTNTEAQEYLSRIGPGLGEPPQRSALELPDSTVYPARTNGDRFEISTPDGWRPFYIQGINLGSALPGKHPSEFPDSAVYARWIGEMADMGANAVRVYTIHPPRFYGALLDYNQAHPQAPLWLIHGVWAELPPDHMYDDPEWQAEFFADMHRVVDLLHGRADLEPRPGHASGYYTVDVSDWVLAYIIGREWEPFSVVAFNEQRPGMTQWSGRYVSVTDGNAMDVWLGRACDEITSYEMSTYRSQRPVAYTNWPTLDPLSHPTEMTVSGEVAYRESIGELVRRYPREYDNDTVGLDATRMMANEGFPAGVFAAYHAYPYYPDFMILDPEYSEIRSSLGASNYFGYLRALKQRHPDMPVVIAEYGVPASQGIAHLQPQGWHHGGHTEQDMAAIDVRLTGEIAEAGMAGGALFAWIDEWFKKNWIVIDYELPPDRNRLWLNRLDAEQQYGMIAMEPGQVFAGASLRERMDSWREVAPLYDDGKVGRLRVAVDEAQLWLLYEPGALGYQDMVIGFDIIAPDAGDFRWPNGVGPRLPVGVEFVLRATEDEVRLLADPPSNPVFIDTVRSGLTADRLRVRGLEDGVPPGFFSGRVEQWFRDEYVTQRNDDGRYDSLRVVTNRPRFTRDGTEFAALGYDRGVLLRGPPPDGNWERLTDGVFEVRIPWMLLNFTDPSQRRVLQDGPDAASFGGDLGTLTVDSIGIVLAVARDGTWYMMPSQGTPVARYSWDTWEQPRWRERQRPVFAAMRTAFETLSPMVLRNVLP